ncbi:TPA: hypothetical protein HA235_02800 [Candidatus Woesearchaeota archaeon]|nr:hypothetical protein [Candidatus Woesearchaeota archaeon]HIH31613.1 hypothetical protein [Candidatus Woesearchaeota archaeon]HIH55345.1 hypothetical protein [Candidatus Woesearchaeota archaeon]HIJ01183.1 hypothetical protein [Candidatus Woesearchaeota archaeon]HIJ14007.1 hypothetical protein [Candidatus Woesearchaeota archaeon]
MRKVNYKRYIFAFVITAAIFLLGFFFGFYMDLQRVNYFQTLSETNRLNIRSLQLQNELINEKTLTNQCSAFRFIFDNAIIELEKNRERLELYQQQANVKKAEFEILRREYTLSQINFWSISAKLKESCANSSDFVTVLFFFGDKEICSDCENQATVLNYYKTQMNQNILIFAINRELADTEPVVNLLMKAYDVNSFPTLVIDNSIYREYIDKEDMEDLLCDIYSTGETRSVIC